VSVAALLAGWLVTEIGRQPWTVQGLLLTRDAASTLEGVAWLLAASVALYLVLLAGMWAALRHLAAKPLPEDARVA
jgi:cytochrome d ubiquinol oxidase subunit I